MNDMTSPEKAAMREFIANRGIRRLVHFTSRRNLIGIFKLGALVARQKVQKYAEANSEEDLMAILKWNDRLRLDGRKDCINLSIEQINGFLFDVFRKKFEEEFHDEEPWCVIEIDPDVLLMPGVVFTTSNAASSYVRAHGTAPGLKGLQALYAQRIVTPTIRSTRIDERSLDMPDACPTSRQAEALVPGEIPLSRILGLVFMSEEDRIGVNVMLEMQFPGMKLPPMRVSEDEFRGPSKEV